MDMKSLPKPILGDITAFTIATPDLEQSLAYYNMLGYAEVMRAEWPFPWIQVSDGTVLIMLRKDPQPYIALTYYVKNAERVVKDLEGKGIAFTQKAKPKDMLKRYVFQSPDGLNVSLVGTVEGFRQPAGPGMLTMKQEDYFKPEQYTNKTCGMYGEFAHPVTDLDASIAFWELLGFTVLSRNEMPYPWAIMSDGLAVVGLHQSGHFSFPAITYFAADMQEKLQRLKKAGLKNYTEQGGGNATLTTPEQQHIFLFSLGGTSQPAKPNIADLKINTLETQRLWLKELSPELMATLLNAYADDELMSFLGVDENGLKTERQNLAGGLTTYRLSFRNFLIVEKESNRVVGRCGFHTWYIQHARAEIGYSINDETAKRKGLMSEAIAAVIDYGFRQMELNRIEAMVGTANEASLKIMNKAGFTREGLMRSHYFKNGRMEDSIVFGLLRSEYESLKAEG